jgi:hypothetical protein
MRDQYFYKTIVGACSYYHALVALAMLKPGRERREAEAMAVTKVQVIIAMQRFQARYDVTEHSGENELFFWLWIFFVLLRAHF